MSFPWGVAIVLGAGALVIRSLATSPAKAGGGASLPPKGDTKGRYSVRRDITAFPFSSKGVEKGAHVVVQLEDSTRSGVFPATLRIANIAIEGDGADWGIDGVWDGSSLEKEVLEGLAIGTHFAVYPRDIMTYLPGKKIGPSGPGTVFKPPVGTGAGGTTLFAHTLSDEDVAIGSTAFAIFAGFASVDGMLADNPTLRAEPSGPTEPGAFRRLEGDLPAFYKVVPWEPGISVKTRRPLPATATASSSTSTSPEDFGAMYAPVYGGRLGYSEFDFGIRNL